MKASKLLKIIGADFYTGVPDSLLRPLCDTLMDRYGTDPRHHIIAANEGSCAALAAGYHLATGRVPVVYLQNSGEGNLINPVVSLLSDRVYAIPAVFIIGWRGEPGTHDEPQHALQGELTLTLLRDLGIAAYVIGKDTPDGAVEAAMRDFRATLDAGRCVAFVIRRGALTDAPAVAHQNDHVLSRESAIRRIVEASGDDPIVCTTGKASRELYEARVANGQGHWRDFLTVGAMGHCASIALGIALNRPRQRVWCIDGDGAALMHMGTMAMLGTLKPKNLIHVVLNNGAHDTVGGMPTAAAGLRFAAVARACGYPSAVCIDDFEGLDRAIEAAKGGNILSLIEVGCAIGARADLGRPTTTPLENKRRFMAYLENL